MDVSLVVGKMAKMAKRFEARQLPHGALYFYSELVNLLSENRSLINKECETELRLFETKAAEFEEKSLAGTSDKDAWLKSKLLEDVEIAKALFQLSLELDEQLEGDKDIVEKLYEQSAAFCFEAQKLDALPADTSAKMDVLSLKALDRAEQLKNRRKSVPCLTPDLPRGDFKRFTLPSRQRDNNRSPGHNSGNFGTLKAMGESTLKRPHLDRHLSRQERSSDTASTTAVILNSGKMIVDPDFNLEPTIPPLSEYLSENEISEMDKESLKKLKVAYELLHTEKIHVRHLKVLHQVFFVPLLMSQTLDEEDLTLLFDQLDQILNLHIQLRNLLVLAQQLDRKFPDLTEILLKVFEGDLGTELGVAASKFCQRQQAAIEVLTTRLAKNPQFDSFLKSAEANPYCRQQKLRDMLPVEMQRLSKYPLLFEQLCKHTEHDSEEFLKLQKLVECSRSLLENANLTKKQWENVIQLQNLQSRLDTTDFDSEASEYAGFECYKNISLDCFTLIYEGDLELKTGKQRVVPLHTLLLDGLLVFLTATGSQPKDFSLKIYNKISGDEFGDTISRNLRRLAQRIELGTEFLKTSRLYFPVLDLTKLIVTKNSEVSTSFYLIYNSEGSRQIYDLRAASKVSQSRWCKEIAEQIKVARRKKGLPETLLPNRKFHSFNAGRTQNFPENFESSDLQQPVSSTNDKNVVRAQSELFSRASKLQRRTRPVIKPRSIVPRVSLNSEEIEEMPNEVLEQKLNQIDLIADKLLEKLNRLVDKESFIEEIRKDLGKIKAQCKTE